MSAITHSGQDTAGEVVRYYLRVKEITEIERVRE